MAGLPIVASDLSVLREVLSADGDVAAAFVPPFDAVAWARAIASSAQPGPATRDAIAQRYSVTRMIDAYAALLGVDANRSRIQWHGGCGAVPDSTARAQRVLIRDRSLRRGVSNE